MQRPTGKRGTPRPQPSARSPLPRYIWIFSNHALQGVTDFIRAPDWIHPLKGGGALSPAAPRSISNHFGVRQAHEGNNALHNHVVGFSVLFLLSVDELIHTPPIKQSTTILLRRETTQRSIAHGPFSSCHLHVRPLQHLGMHSVKVGDLFSQRARNLLLQVVTQVPEKQFCNGGNNRAKTPVTTSSKARQHLHRPRDRRHQPPARSCSAFDPVDKRCHHDNMLPRAYS